MQESQDTFGDDFIRESTYKNRFLPAYVVVTEWHSRKNPRQRDDVQGGRILVYRAVTPLARRSRRCQCKCD